MVGGTGPRGSVRRPDAFPTEVGPHPSHASRSRSARPLCHGASISIPSARAEKAARGMMDPRGLPALTSLRSSVLTWRTEDNEMGERCAALRWHYWELVH